MNEEATVVAEDWWQVRRRQLDDVRRRLAAVDVDDDGDGDGWRWRARSVAGTCRASRPQDRVNRDLREELTDNEDDDDDELDTHRRQRRQRLHQAVGGAGPSVSNDTGRLGVRRGGSVESDCGSRSDRDGSTDGSASASTDTDHDHATSDVNWRCGKALRQNDVISHVFHVKQYVLQEEARLALQQAQRMAHMQVELEKHSKKKSPIAEVVGMSHFGDTSMCLLQHKQLTMMSVGELQLIVNDLLSQIKGLNADLVQLLLDRDELYMQQDSFLVDIDDLNRRGLETVSCYDLRNSVNDR